MGTREKAALVLMAAALGAAALAAETISYRYDARGRLVKVEHAGGVNANAVTDYRYDKADNRIVKNSAGSP